MNKFCIYALAFTLSLSSVDAYSRGDDKRVFTASERKDDTFCHTIERGQTVYAIATMYGVSVDDIYRLNPGSENGIKAGATLRIPQKNAGGTASDGYIYHTIRPKETLYSLSVRYAIPAMRIVEANPGLSTSTFTAGKTIRIPMTPAEDEGKEAGERPGQQEEIEYTVQKRETMYRICRKFDITSSELLKWNPELRNGVKAGMVIKIPVATTEETIIQENKNPDEREVNALLSAPRDIERVERIRVALLLPFMAGDTTRASATARFVEYYEGFLLAVDSLKEMGTSIELSVYDTGEGTRQVRQILEEEALADANLIIGAVQNDQIGLIAKFAQEKDIKYVIPFTSRNDDVLSNANVYQVNTPHSYLYSKAAQAGCDLFRDQNIILVDIKDAEVKTDFVKAFKTEMSQRGIPFKELSYNGETFAEEVEALMTHDKRNVILPTSASLDAVNKIKAPLRMLSELKEEEKEPYLVTLFGYPEWQTYTRSSLEDFYALDTYIYSNFYADNLSPEVHAFYREYKDWFSKSLINTFPKYGILGFDTGMFFLGAIRTYGSNFEDNLDKIRYKSIQTGFDFHRVNNWGGFINTNLFIVHYKNDFTVVRDEIR